MYGNVLTNSGMLRFGGILTWGLLTYTHRLKAEPEVHRCGEFDFLISEFNKKLRMSELAPLGNLESDSEQKISIRPFIFRSKLVSMEGY